MPLPYSWTFGPFHLDYTRYELLRSGHALRIERIPLELLLLLVRRNGELVVREEISECLWGPGIHVDSEQGINTAIHKLRQILRDDAENPKFIQTVVGKGYRFVRQVSEEQLSAPEEMQPPEDPAVGPIPAWQAPRLWMVTAVVSLVLASAASWFSHRTVESTV